MSARYGSDPLAVALDPGEIVTCTFVSTQGSSITITKATDPQTDIAGAVFTFGFTTDAPDAAGGFRWRAARAERLRCRQVPTR